jgi:hypothetical protein
MKSPSVIMAGEYLGRLFEPEEEDLSEFENWEFEDESDDQ